MIVLPEMGEVTPLYPSPRADQSLRVVVICNGDTGPGWLAEFFRQLRACGFAQAHWYRAASHHVPSRSRICDALLRLDRLALRALAPIVAARSLRSHTGGANVGDRRIWVEVDNAGRSVVNAEVARELRELQPDLLLLVGLPPASPELAAVGRHGAWTLDPSAISPNRCGVWMFDEFISGAAAVHSGVLVHDARSDSWRLLEPGYCTPTRLNFSRHRAYQLQKVPAKLIGSLRRLAAGLDVRWLPWSMGAPMRGRDVARYWFHALPAVARQLFFSSRWPERWFVAVRRSSEPLDPTAANGGWRDYRRLQSPEDRFWADPCLWHDGGRDFVFVESLRDERGKAEIAAIELSPDLSIRSVRDVLKLPTHLSYPFLFCWQGDTFMLVESATTRRVPVFKSGSFPDGWHHVGDALSGWRAVDATLYCQSQTWWLFVCVADTAFDDGGREWDDLFVFHAESPLGPWNPHPENPVVRDVRSARPAGPLFLHNGRLIRPGQDCAGEYGRAVVFNEVVHLSKDRYEERPIGTLNPDWATALRGCHLYARSADIEVVDAKLATRYSHRQRSRR